MLHRSTLVTTIFVAAVAPAFADEIPGVVTGDAVIVRGELGPDGKTFPTPLRRGEQVTVIGKVGSDLKIARRAFVHGSYVVEGQVANCYFLNVRAGRNGQVVKALAAGTPLRLTGKRNGDWLEIETEGFVPMSEITPVTDHTLNLAEAEPLTKLEPTTPLLEVQPIEIEPLQPIEIEPIEIEPLPLDIQLPQVTTEQALTAEDAQAEAQTEAYVAALEAEAAQAEALSDPDLAEVEALLAELEADPEGMYDAHQESFRDRAEFDEAIEKCRTLCEQLRAHTDAYGIAGTYTLSRSRAFGKNPKVVLTIQPSSLRDHYTVDRVRTLGDEVVENRGGVGKWDASKGKLEVEWDRKNGLAQVMTNGQDQGDDGAGATAGDYRILASTGEIKGNFASPEEGWSKEKGWRDGSIKPLEGTYTLEPTWYAFGNKPKTTLTVGPAREDGTRVVTRVVGERGIALEGVAEIKDRKLKVEFPNHPRISYTIEENGKVKGTWRTEAHPADDHQNGDYREERGWQDGATQEELPGVLKRSWQGLKRAFKR